MKDYLRLGRATDLTKRSERWLYRFLEMLPGLLAWGTLTIVVAFSFWFPVSMAIFIIVFDLYWFIKTLYLSFHLRHGFNNLQKNLKISWLGQLKAVNPASYSLPSIKSWRDIYHFIVLPSYKDAPSVIAATLDGLVNSSYPKDKMIVVLTQEQRAGAEHNDRVRHELEHKYSNIFFKFIILDHPADIVGELAGKGANIYWAGKKAKAEIIDTLQILYDHILVSVFDIDTIVFPEYFARLTYVYLTTHDPLHASYQPIPTYLNNIWEAPSLSRIPAFSTTFWQTIKQEQFESMITYSSHSMPFTALVDVGFWQNNIISEDSRIFWQCLLYYDGDYRVEPLHYPVSMDANLADSFWQTIVNIYKQHRRWGYGAENVSYFVFGFIKNKKIAFKKKFYYTFVMLEGIWSWSTNAIILFLLGWLPVVVGGAAFNTTVLSYNLPYLTRFIMSFAMLGLITSAVMTMTLLPPRPKHYGRIKHIWMAVQWLLFPLTSISLNALPALEAQTRLLLGQYMGFWVTPKIRAPQESKTTIEPIAENR